MEDKLEIRREVRQRIKDINESKRASAAKNIFLQIEQNAHFISANCIALFVSMRDEVTTEYALDSWLSMGKHIVIPRVEGDIMRFYDYSPDTMQEGAFGIMEPTSNDEVAAENIDLIIVPARAFTLSGIRLGRGGGFYDKYMSQPEFRAYKIGIAYKCQIFDTLPHAEHDIKVDEVIFA